MKTAKQMWLQSQQTKPEDKELFQMAEEERQERKLERKMAKKHGMDL